MSDINRVHGQNPSSHQKRRQQNNDVRSSVEGTAARKIVPQHEKVVRNKRKRITKAQKRTLRLQKIIFVTGGLIAVCAVMYLSAAMLMISSVKSSLDTSVYRNEKTLNELTVSNEAKKYEIDNSIDLNQIIQTATEELGMVRVSTSQVVKYSLKNSEYLLQVAAVPAK